MNVTQALPQIVEQLAKATGCSRDEAVRFVMEFSDIVGDALERGESVEIAGIGSFRCVATPGGTDVVFVAEESLTEAVNAPFAMFEPVELDDEVTEEMLEAATSDKPQTDASDPVTDESIGGTTPDDNTTSEVAEKNDKAEATPTETAISEETSATEEIIEAIESMDTPAIAPGEAETVSTDGVTEEEEAVPGEGGRTLNDTQPKADENGRSAASPTDEGVRAPRTTSESTPRYSHEIRTERYDFYDGDTSERRNRKSMNLNSILIAFLALLAGLLIGYFGHNMLNLSGVRSVNISAEDVQVYHQVTQPEESVAPAEAVEAAETAPAPEKSPEASDAAAQTPAEASPTVTAKGAEAETTAVTDTVKAGRFLTTIAQRHYGKKKFWVYIYLENAENLGNPDLIPPMTVVRIPSLEKYGVKTDDKWSEEDAERRATEILNRYSKN